MRYSALDGLRGTAALIVVVSHFSNQTGLFGGLLGQGAGQTGVMIFFLISGFLMGRLYIELPINGANVLKFARKRYARVVPLYLFIVATSAIAYPLLGKPAILYPINRGDLLPHLLAIHGISLLWTIPVEIQFYALFPAIWFCFSYIGRAWSSLILLAIGLIAISLQLGPPRTLPYHLHYFCFGILVALLCRPLKAAPQKTWAWDILFVIAILGAFLTMPKVAGAFGLNVGAAWRSLAILGALTGLLWTTLRSSLAESLLGSRAGRFVGDISYSIYLWHYPIFLALGRVQVLWDHLWLFVAVYTLAILAVSWLSYRIIELPARRYINESSFRAWRAVNLAGPTLPS